MIEKISHENTSDIKASLAIFISNKIFFKTKVIASIKEHIFITFKCPIHHELINARFEFA